MEIKTIANVIIISLSVFICTACEKSNNSMGGRDTSTIDSDSETDSNTSTDKTSDSETVSNGGSDTLTDDTENEDPATCEQAVKFRSYTGCEFWPTVTYNPVWDNFNFAVVISNGQSVTADIVVKRNGVEVASAAIAPASLGTILLPWVDELKGPMFDNATSYGRVKDSVRVDDGAYNLTSSVPVAVWQFNPLEYTSEGTNAGTCPVTDLDGFCLSACNDASILLPTSAMTGNYRVFGRSDQDDGDAWGSTASAFTVTGTNDNTEVKIQFSDAVAKGTGIDAMNKGAVGIYSINAGDVLQFIGVYGGYPVPHTDLSGSVVNADNPVQIISLNPIANIPYHVPHADHIEETVMPIESIGNEYIVATPSAPRGNVVGHIVRFTGSVDGTTLTYDGDVPANVPLTLDAGQIVEIGDASALINKNFIVKGDKPFAVISLMISGDKQDLAPDGHGSMGDPAMTIMITPKQFRKKYNFLAPKDYVENYADIFIPDGANVKLDDVILSGVGEKIGDTGWTVVREKLSAGPGGDGFHYIESDIPVGLQVMGFGYATSYYYPGGLNTSMISEPVIISID